MAGFSLVLAAILVSLVSLMVDVARGHYTPTWAVHIPEGSAAADAVAAEHGFVNLGEIFIALAFYATGSYQTLVGQSYFHNVSQTTVSRAVRQVTAALNNPRVFKKYVKWPMTLQERNRIKANFYQKFGIPGVLGCIDGTHVTIIRPDVHEERYINRKGHHSLNVMIICDSYMNILAVDASHPGSAHDSIVWNGHPLSAHLSVLSINGENLFLLGDSGYPLRKTMMTPILNAAEGTPEQHYYKKHVTARNTVERCIGVLKARFRCLLFARALHYNPVTAGQIVNACTVLHNLAMEWNLEVPTLSVEEAQREAAFQQQIFDNHYHFKHHHVSKRSLTPAHEHHETLERDSRVRWAQQQKALKRKKRDFIEIPSISSSVETKTDGIRPSSSASKRDAGQKRELQSSRVKGRPRAADSKFQLNDPKWPHMWYLNRGGGLDMNVMPAWREGITGKGVVVTILDDGLETDHPDLVSNYDPMASYDVNSQDSDPTPRYDPIDSNRHGTRCAGEVAATANNSLCAVGVAFDASVGGVRMLDGDVTDAVEARSLSLNPQHVDIYSASWGPDDDGKTVDGPGELATRAFIEGVTKGRDGKGSIFVWASGNGGREQDNCNCDGYTNSIWTLSISSATERGEVPWYSEMCSSTLAATYSSGAINEKQVVTTDLHHSCTTGHTGTSASAPLAAGICALALQANRELTWRDMQHIVVRSARPERLSSGGEWKTNGVGRSVSHSFGYGLLDAEGMVRLARSWKTVPPQRRCELASPRPQKSVPARSSVTLRLDVGACPGVNYLEHVQARVSLSAARRGDLRIALTSPAGTKVTLLAPRPHDSSRAGFTSWPFMSVHMWGESPLGMWQLEVYNDGRYMGRATLQEWSLILYGTTSPATKNDPMPSQNPIIYRNKVNATRPVVVSAARKKSREKNTPIVPTYTVGLVKRKKNKNSKINRKNKQEKPTILPVESTTMKVTLMPEIKEFRSESAQDRKMSKLFEQYPKIQRIYQAPLQTNAGPITQWELIFYGTETPPQEDDVATSDSNALEPPVASERPLVADEVKHNEIHEDFGTWHDSQAIRDESHELGGNQPNLTSGCATQASLSPHYCLECVTGYHLFEGHCFEKCPDGSYPSEVLSQRGSRRRNLTHLENHTVMKRSPVKTDLKKSPLICLSCHYSCLTCSGPNTYDCVTCPGDAELVNSTDELESKFFCYPSSVIPQISNAKWHYKLNVTLIIITVILSAILLYFLGKYICEKYSLCCFEGSYQSVNMTLAYQKLANDDKKQAAFEIENEIHDAINGSSDTDSDDDLNL